MGHEVTWVGCRSLARLSASCPHSRDHPLFSPHLPQVLPAEVTEARAMG